MRVAVLGGGYAGVTTVRRLEGKLPDVVGIVLVDDTGEHLVQHELHRVIRRPSLADEITLDLDDVVDRAEVRGARVEDVAPDPGVATLANGERLAYDFGVVALGAGTNFYGMSGVRKHATPLKRVEHARTIRAGFLEAIAARNPRVVVSGAGLSGVQVAGELAALADEEDADPEIVLLEMADQVAPTFPPDFRAAVRSELEARGVVVRTGWRVEDATADAVETDRGSLEYDQLIWTGGIKGTEAVGGDRPVVNRTLRLGEATFGAGDAVRVVDRDGQTVPDSAQTAIRQAPVAAENVRRLVEHAREDDGGFEPRLESYTYDSRGWVVSVGDGAVAQVGPTVWRGRAAKALKTSVGAGYLSSVGGVRDAVDLVNEELGIAEAVDEEAPDAE